MKSYTITAATACVLFGVCLFVSGCGTSQTNNPKMETSGAMMSSDSKMSGNMMADDKKMSGNMMSSDSKMTSDAKMSGNMMADDKMSSTNKMSSPKMDKMSEGKMEKGDATGK